MTKSARSSVRLSPEQVNEVIDKFNVTLENDDVWCKAEAGDVVFWVCVREALNKEVLIAAWNVTSHENSEGAEGRFIRMDRHDLFCVAAECDGEVIVDAISLNREREARGFAGYENNYRVGNIVGALSMADRVPYKKIASQSILISATVKVASLITGGAPRLNNSPCFRDLLNHNREAG